MTTCEASCEVFYEAVERLIEEQPLPEEPGVTSAFPFPLKACLTWDMWMDWQPMWSWIHYPKIRYMSEPMDMVFIKPSMQAKTGPV